MYKKLIFTLFLFLHSFFVFSQTESTQYQKFFADFLGFYKEFSKPPLKNYYDVLSNTAKFSFDVTNPLFINALSAISTEKNVSEEEAVDLLLRRVFRDLKKGQLWVMAPDIYNSKKEMFALYYTKLCGCLNSKVKPSNLMDDNFVEAQNQCISEMVTDTAFLNKLRLIAGGTTLNDMYNVSNYLTVYMYGNCEIFYDKLNGSIFSTGVVQYLSGIEFLKKQQGQSVIRYFRLGQWDSLSAIFPEYKKHKNELQKIVANTSGKDIVTKGYYHRSGSPQGKQVIDVHFYKNSENYNPFGRADVNLSGANFDSKIISIKYFIEKPIKEGKIIEDRVIEIKSGGN